VTSAPDQILENLDPAGVIVTKHGRPIAKVLPVTTHDNERFIGAMKAKIKVHGDLLTTGLTWDAESRHSHSGRVAKRRTKHR
jgi:antitoxin (DNA-binding transcriptional repressor) of toxin-antitoxin stability system